MAAVHHFEIAHIPAKTRARQTLLPWLKDAAAAIGFIAFVGSCFVLMDALQGLFA